MTDQLTAEQLAKIMRSEADKSRILAASSLAARLDAAARLSAAFTSSRADYCRQYRQTRTGFLTSTYHTLVNNSKSRNLPIPDFSAEEFYRWVLIHDNFEPLYNDWVTSGFDKWLRPSVDRLNNNLGYRFDNIRLVTWRENYAARDVRKCGVDKHEFVPGRKFGYWEVLSEPIRLTGYRQNRKWTVRCSCGQVRDVRVSALIRGKSTNCGHVWQAEFINQSTKHGLLVGFKTSKGRPRTYRKWEQLKAQKMLSQEWEDFAHFLQDIGDLKSNQYIRKRDESLPLDKNNFYLVTRQDPEHPRCPKVKN